MSQVAYTSHDDPHGEYAKVVDAGLDAANHAAAPLGYETRYEHAVYPLGIVRHLMVRSLA